MSKIVTITTQGQLTIPKNLRDAFGISGNTKAVIRQEGNHIIVEPKTDFWSLSGSLKSSVTLTDSQLKNARKSFSKKWTKKQ